MSTWLITGVTGQDGSYLVEQARECGCDVVHLAPEDRGTRVPHLATATWDFADTEALRRILRDVRPTRFFNLAAYSTGAGMFDDPAAIGELNGIAVARMLQAVADVDPAIRFCQASSSEMFGDPVESPQRESTGFNPESPYAAAKLFAHTAVGAYRRRRGLFACSAILFNHESPRRSAAFVTRKIADAVARIKAGQQRALHLETLEAQRDWGYAPDYVRAMRMMLEHHSPDDYVVATGELHSVREFCEIAFTHVGLDWRDWVVTARSDPRSDTRRPRVGDATRLRRVLGWAPSTDFTNLVQTMVDASVAHENGSDVP